MHCELSRQHQTITIADDRSALHSTCRVVFHALPDVSDSLRSSACGVSEGERENELLRFERKGGKCLLPTYMCL